ncbi:PACE efflux transporter [Halocynthiibacter styelae]|uniref:PACE efflux transporter n=1 Tax=Halocynthiibacter styelae TaxID=2761955 RepID=A0A8J7ILU0_9RHOB|nr:PACE efflux transporter [Paenihalocynthiibacter styelae]MBI1492826.1 PACE efflux transporter [Paenihalocynthiibacter styelae]
MRTFKDRLRHTLLFELIALTLVAIFGAWITGHSPAEMGTLGLMMSLLAMAWNLVYNWMFDQWDMKYRNMAPRGVKIRIIHALLFEGGLLIAGIFVVAWWLSITLLQALLLDLGFAAFFLVYAYVFNLAYDKIFPVPAQQALAS